MSAMWSARVPWLVLGASVALVLSSCGTSPGSRIVDVAAQSGTSVPSARAQDRAVTKFIHGLRSERLSFEPAADWNAGRLIFAVPHPMFAPWPGLAGQVIGG